MSLKSDLDRRPSVYKTLALPTELFRQFEGKFFTFAMLIPAGLLRRSDKSEFLAMTFVGFMANLLKLANYSKRGRVG